LIGTIGHYATLVALVDLAGADPVVSSGVGFAVGAFINYTLNYRCTFRSNERHALVAPRFLLVASIGISINLLIMYCLVTGLNLYYLAAQVISTGIVLLWNFAGNRFWAFRSAPLRRPTDPARSTRH
jgi:putative flippase GtrA